MGAVGAAALTLFSVRQFYTHRNPLKPVKIQEFHCKLVELDFLHPQLSISDVTPKMFLLHMYILFYTFCKLKNVLSFFVLILTSLG